MEEIITDSPIFIETEYLTKIMQAYTEVDQGTPAFFGIVIAKLIEREVKNIDNL